MITKVNAKGLKGLEFETPLSRLNLLVGANGAGKTARLDALKLSILGYVPGVARKNQDILNTHGSSDKLFVSIETEDRTHFLRRFLRGESGSVSQDVMLNRRKSSKEQYAAAMAGIKLFDLQGFMDLSDQKKIDAIFALFPPTGDLGALDEKIEGLKEKQNGILAQIRGLEQSIARITQSIVKMELPAGTLAEVSAQIRETERELEEARNALQAARIDQARVEAEEKARKEAEAQAARDKTRIEAEARVKAESEAYARVEEERQLERELRSIPESPALPGETGKAIQERQQVCQAMPPRPVMGGADPGQSIAAILDTMNRAGCSACTAVLVAKRELRKYRGAQERKVA